ncbi:MAG: glycosyltransferase family 2 protein [Myxococcota bacterium]
MTDRPQDALVSFVVPVLDEEGCIEEFARRARAAATQAGIRYELIFVDDGSADGTPDKIAELRSQDLQVKTIRLTRSFGHQAALVAGLRFASGDAVVTMDGDLQHPPECVPDLIRAWREGADVVNTGRRPLPGRPTRKDRSSKLFYRLLGWITAVPVVATSADFRLLDRKVVDAFNALDEHFLFVRGLIPWLGFRDAFVAYQLEDRFAGKSKYHLRRQFRLALDAIFSFSVIPLRLISLLGVATTVFGVAFGAFWLVSYFLGRVEGSGGTSIVILILIFGGVQLLSLGIVSEYVGRTYEEVKRRPRYVIGSTSGIEPDAAEDA